ncbi:MAG: DUF1460 domain-containing protein [Ignavibacteriaceae bacterium]|nr:DUF1460 domain-containing protein [Ignavibacteriaceae bacterium]
MKIWKGLISTEVHLKRFFKQVLFTVLLFSVYLNSQVFTETDKAIFDRNIKYAFDKGFQKLDVSLLPGKTGRLFTGTEYLAFALEVTDSEELVVNLSGLDCYTLVENAVVFTRLLKQKDSSFSSYLNNLQFIRYRGGEISGYTSRLHYTSDWIYDNINKGVVKDISQSLGGEKLNFNLSFMSKNPSKYKHLKNNPSNVAKMKEIEKEISARDYFYIPKSEISKKEKYIEEGDIIAIVTNIEGLDISHIGIAVIESGETRFLHAPMPDTKVQITRSSLSKYVNAIKSNKGIIVLRVM